MHTKIEFEAAFQRYYAGVQRIYNDYCDKQGYAHRDAFRFDVLKKRIRVVCGSGVHSFVDIETGNVLKPASFAAPAKHARGNIFEQDGLAHMGPHGPAYLR